MDRKSLESLQRVSEMMHGNTLSDDVRAHLAETDQLGPERERILHEACTKAADKAKLLAARLPYDSDYEILDPTELHLPKTYLRVKHYEGKTINGEPEKPYTVLIVEPFSPYRPYQKRHPEEGIKFYDDGTLPDPEISTIDGGGDRNEYDPMLALDCLETLTVIEEALDARGDIAA